MSPAKPKSGRVQPPRKEKDKSVDEMVKEYKQAVKQAGDSYSLQIVITEVMKPRWKKPRRVIEWAWVLGEVEGGDEPDPKGHTRYLRMTEPY